jgi:hypothetical protein
MITRAHILEVLEGELNALEERELEDRAANDLHQVLLVLIDGLESLNAGEVPPLFAPAEVKTWGEKPATTRMLRLHAIGAVAALQKAGCSIEKAIFLVADAYARSTEAIRQWRKTLGKNKKDTEAQMIKGLWVSRVQTFHWTKDGLLKDLKRKGQEFKKAQVKKGK